MPLQYTQRVLALTFTLFTSTSSSMVMTPTAPPVKEATKGSTSGRRTKPQFALGGAGGSTAADRLLTSLSCFGRPRLATNSA